MELMIALIALALSTATGIWSIRQNRELVEAMKLTNIASIVNVERSLGDVPSALRFHGVTSEDLVAAGITVEELAYLLANCSASALYHNFSGENPDKPFGEGSYRRAMCTTAAFRKAWPLLRRMLSAGIFVSRMNATVALFEAKHGG